MLAHSHPLPARWLSAHLHFDAPSIYGSETDQVIRSMVVPLVAELRSLCDIDGFFFIRYTEGGPHVRVRMRGPVSHCDERARRVADTRVQSLQTASATPVRSVWTEYEPEIDRYGGPHALAISERIFEVSSIAALALLTVDLELSARLGRALLAMLATIHVFLNSHAAARSFVQRYCEGYLTSVGSRGGDHREVLTAFRRGVEPQQARLRSFVAEAWRALSSSHSLPDPVDAYVQELRDLRDELQRCHEAGHLIVDGSPAHSWAACVQWLLPSYVHMMNNRLGVSIDHEAYLALIIEAGLADWDAPGIRL